MKTTKLFFALLFIVTAFSRFANAQTDSCITYLKTANSNYEQRYFDDAIKLLQSALNNCNLDKSDKLQAHKLLALSYIGIDNLEAADHEAEAIVKIDPNYAPDKFKDDTKYSALFEKFKPVPVLRIGFMAGSNKSSISVDNYFSMAHNDDEASQFSSYQGKYGFQLGVTVEYRIWKDLWIELQGQYRSSNYAHDLNLAPTQNSTIHYTENLSYLDLPVLVKYYFPVKKWAPYINAGADFSFLANALSTSTRDDVKDLVNRTDYRESFMVGYFAGLGVMYRLKSLNLFADFRYIYFDKNINKDGTRYSDEVNVYKYMYIDDDFSMNNMQVNVGLTYNLGYKNKKG
jgi:hypothetical protein